MKPAPAFTRIAAGMPWVAAVLIVALPAFLNVAPAHGQVASPTTPVEGMTVKPPGVHAFINATLVTAPGSVLRDVMLVIRDGVIESIEDRMEPPADARVWDMRERTLYPGFIDAHTHVGMTEPRLDSERGTPAWNPRLRAHLRAEDEFRATPELSRKLRSQGFTAVKAVPGAGIFRGQTAVFSLGRGGAAGRLLRRDVAQSVALVCSGDFDSGYPTSPAGTLALIRQTLLDTEWHHQVHRAYRERPAGLQRPETIAPLAALLDAARGRQPLLFATRDDEEMLRVLRLTHEFPVLAWIRGNGHEYKILEVLADNPLPLVLPVAFPAAPEVDTPEDALNRSLAELRHWYLAPENPARVAAAGLAFALTADGLEDPSDFLARLRAAVEAGLDPDTALAALTLNPARMLGIETSMGTLETGKAAHFVVTDGDLFKADTRVMEVWVDGDRFVIEADPSHDPAGTWTLETRDSRIQAELRLRRQRPDRYAGSITLDGIDIELQSVRLQAKPLRLWFDVPGDTLGIPGRVRLTATITADRLHGWAEIPGQERLQWHGVRTAADAIGAVVEAPPTDDLDSDEHREDRRRPARDLRLADIHPPMEYGRESLPPQPRHVLVRNATIWTMGPAGIMENADLLVSSGMVAAVGRNLRQPRHTLVIDGSGRHVTPGLIDAHFHSGLMGTNEIGNATVPEVRMADALTRYNIWMYRQLAGGLTTGHAMHGSANPIGGQNVFVKMRWGSLPDELVMDQAPRTVKLALGENPKRIGSGRYPDTRMGVEQIIADRFHMARDYQARWKLWEQTGEGLPPRRDLRLEALAEILDEDLLIQAHCYRQDEILALIRLAETFDITIEVFHHGVEAYKVAPELAAHGAAVVAWSDWSSFKIEAYDATVYNVPLLHAAGVLTSLHSDDHQLAARLNWEAAKMVRAGMAPEEALALVTIAPARLHRIDHRVGSLEPGKDGDFVIWSGDPLSTLSRTEQTWIEGRRYFDQAEDAELRRAVATERAALIQRILDMHDD